MGKNQEIGVKREIKGEVCYSLSFGFFSYSSDFAVFAFPMPRTRPIYATSPLLKPLSYLYLPKLSFLTSYQCLLLFLFYPKSLMRVF